MANSEDPDEIPHYAAFHQGVHCLLRYNRSTDKEIQYFCKLSHVTPQYMYAMDHPQFIGCNFMENDIGLKKVNTMMRPSHGVPVPSFP